MESKYLDKFVKLQQEGKFELHGDFILVEKIPEQEKKTKSGIVLSSMPSTHVDLKCEHPVFCHVLYVGSGFYDEEGKPVDCKLKPGNVVLVPPMAAAWYKTFLSIVCEGDAVIGKVLESEIHASFDNIDDYIKAADLLGY